MESISDKTYSAVSIFDEVAKLDKTYSNIIKTGIVAASILTTGIMWTELEQYKLIKKFEKSQSQEHHRLYVAKEPSNKIYTGVVSVVQNTNVAKQNYDVSDRL